MEFTRESVIGAFAEKIAELQRKADVWYYKDNPPKKNKNEHASWLLDQIIPLKEMCRKMEIADEVYALAYEIYDFRNSGKSGYGLVDGKIEVVDESAVKTSIADDDDDIRKLALSIDERIPDNTQN